MFGCVNNCDHDTSTGATAVTDAHFGQGNSSIHIDNVQCSGTESALIQCTHTTLHDCSHIEDAGVRCGAPSKYIMFFMTVLLPHILLDNCTDGDVQAVGGQHPGEGRVEICLQGVWGTVCDDYFDTNDANVVCRQLGLPGKGAAVYNGAYFGQGTGPFHIQYIGCSGSESDLLQCSQGTYPYCSSHVEDAGVRCAGNSDSQLNQCDLRVIILIAFSAETCDNEGEIRLAGGNEEGEGRVEICRGGAWGTVCDDYWGTPDATVVCRQLGFSTVGEHIHNN